MPSQSDDLLGQVVAGRYRVLSQLGAGGMGTVYLAEHEAIEKKVALKVLRPEYSAKPDLVTRFQREAISASRIKHPNVLDVFDFGRLDNGSFYLAMEFLEGHDLADELERCHVLRPERALRLMMQIAKALATAHVKGVVHRDLKPENVFLQLTADGEETVKIVDFGIAQLRSTEEIAASEPRRRRLTRTGMIFGTPEYMSPEQAAGRRMDLRVDVYAAGVILYEMLTGAVPFTGDTFFGVLNAHMNDPLPSLASQNPTVSISPQLEVAVEKALSKNPDERFQSMRELAQALMATPEASAVDPHARKSLIPSVTLAEFDTAAQASERDATNEPLPLLPDRAAATHVAPQGAPARTGAEVNPDDVARADTLVAQDPDVPAAKSKRVAWLFAGLALAAVAAAALLRLFPGATATASSEVPASEGVSPDGLASAPTAAPSPAPVVSPMPAPAASASVRIDVATIPAGAVLLKNGFQVCDTTPCEVLASPNESLELEARKGKLRGNAKVLAQRAQSVEIELVAASTKRPSTGTKPPEKVWCYREVQQGDLKVLQKFRCPGQ